MSSKSILAVTQILSLFPLFFALAWCGGYVESRLLISNTVYFTWRHQTTIKLKVKPTIKLEVVE